MPPARGDCCSLPTNTVLSRAALTGQDAAPRLWEHSEGPGGLSPPPAGAPRPAKPQELRGRPPSLLLGAGNKKEPPRGRHLRLHAARLANSTALPRAGTDGVRTRDLRFTRPTPYHLATAPDGLAAAARRQWKAAGCGPPGPGAPPGTERWGGTGGAVPSEPGPGTGTGRTGGTRPALPRVPGSPAWSSLPPFSRFAPVSLSSAYAGEAA